MTRWRSSFLVSAAIACLPGAHCADQPLTVNSINLAGWEDCSSTQQRAISHGWEDAVSLANALRSPNFNEAAALEFLGPPGFNKQYQQSISDIFTRVSTFGQGSRGVPSFFKWTVYVRCDDWRGACLKLRNAGAAAYTENWSTVPNDPDGKRVTKAADRKTSFTVINYCSRYFNYPRLNDKINEKLDQQANIKLNLDWYRANTGYVTFHEMMHSDLIAFEKNGNRHIYDQQFRLNGEDDRRDIYGATMTKVLARTDTEANLGQDVTSNADNFAQYALALAVQKKIGIYPHLPILTGKSLVEDSVRPPYGQLLIKSTNSTSTWNDNLPATFFTPTTPDSSYTCDNTDDNSCNALVIQLDSVNITFIDDSAYPQDYVDQYKAWLSNISTQSTLPDLPGEPNDSLPAESGDLTLQCFKDPIFSDVQTSATQSFIQTSIGTTCDKFNGLTLDQNGQPLLNLSYPVPNTNDEVWLRAGWQINDPTCTTSRNISEGECSTMLSTVLNDCDTDSTDFKYGGFKVNECIVWTISLDGSPRVTPDNPSGQSGQTFSCQLNPQDTQQCICNDGNVYDLDSNGKCDQTSPPT